MKYFVTKEVKLLTKDKLANFEYVQKSGKIAVQVEKNNFQSGKEICDILENRHIKTHILADSDRCCIDWVAVVHSHPDKTVIKRSFSCPLLNITRSKNISETYCIIQYIPEPCFAVEKKECPADLIAQLKDLKNCTLYLAIDILFMENHLDIKEYLEKIVDAPIKDWEYEAELEDNHAVLVVTENKGFSDYFRENHTSILLHKEDMQSIEATVQKIKEETAGMQTRRTKLLISKMSFADILKKSDRIGVVFTSADHMQLIDLISKYLDINKKKFYQFYINGLKPNKLGNFVGIDVFIVIQCPFSSFRFEENIVALRPYDLLLAFKKEWNGEYSTKLEIAQRDITKEIEQETAKISTSEDAEPSTMLEIKSSINALKLSKNEICTKEMAQKYFQTGEYMKKINRITIEETVCESANNELVKGYFGIPTEYIKE